MARLLPDPRHHREDLTLSTDLHGLPDLRLTLSVSENEIDHQLASLPAVRLIDVLVWFHTTDPVRG